MNPSANGWIKKLIKELSNQTLLDNPTDYDFYKAFRNSGFIYGYNIKIVNDYIINEDLTEEELCKVNLCIAFINAHKTSGTELGLFDSIINFYTAINENKTSFLGDLLGRDSAEVLVEKIMHKRIQIHENVISKNFNHYITNVLLYIDIIAYDHFLETKSITKSYLEILESTIITIVIEALSLKSEKSDYDKSLIELFQSSLRYEQVGQLTYIEAIENAKKIQHNLYYLDIACMAAWSDAWIEPAEAEFLENLSTALQINKEDRNESLNAINLFFNANRDKIPLLSAKNVVKSFYNRSSQIVTKLITRNSHRLLRELRDSKELMVLLTKSTVRDLTSQERKKVNEQLLDIFKSIPSLAIFLLPGGAILLPIVIKFIPKLLPSAFDDNRIEDED
ncbi:LETM1-like protein [Formosa agariphila KMM 3901]|uniref:LETM1-like protein n=1 Tax=Formosa agariphila (strain DSM 15362 / KCTC 12365 / LMG 23005 / KMM 3901 / M-2Alg 35-1) TaxID=1347342 RepID=T2KLU7_FORAG|nr:LETM1-related biofilm-associated protein [Formosa agariphila]CDF79715.1 LETM1-like protein [Formosa agariphila KMM 3901]